MAATNEVEGQIDGRTARAIRTRDAIVEACLDLVDDGDLRPTGPRIAERAGVSVRSIFQHFDDLDALFAAVGTKVRDRLADVVRPIDVEAPIDDRIAALVAQRAAVLESITPVLRAALVHAAGSAVIKETFERGHGSFRSQVRHTFEAELAGADEPEVLGDALVVALSWSTWELLRTAQGRSIEESAERMEWMVRSSLRGAGIDA